MNLVAASRRIPKIFIADEDQIRIITTPNGTGPCDALKFESAIPRQFADDESTGYLVPQFVETPPTSPLVLALHPLTVS